MHNFREKITDVENDSSYIDREGSPGFVRTRVGAFRRSVSAHIGRFVRCLAGWRGGARSCSS